ncbi:MAG: histidine--tRNA ligase [Candidatus Amesbacteria bacterium]|nr:histidine--tRNA ligase [Candidatus Amesbacteria bacterium]
MNSIQTLKGFRDFLPEEALRRAWLREQIVKVFEKWGYDPMETPTLEPLELFAGQIGEDEKLFFKFEDNGGRQVALRYDQTVPTCRVVGANQLTMPFRRYQIQPAFRAENTQKGRYREFVQCDADIFGSTSPLADAEVIALSLDIYKSLGFKNAKVLVNDRSLLAGLPYEAIVAIDKLAKIGEDGVIKDMISKNIPEDKAREYFDVVNKIQPNETIKTIFGYLKSCGFDENWYVFEPTLARSFSYSTGAIWEVVIPELGGGSVLGGERFDDLVEKISGRKIPGTGFGLGFDRTLEAAIQLNLVPEFKTKTKVLVTIFSEELVNESIKLVNKLRENNINCELYPDVVKLDKQLKYADAKGIPFVAIIGPEEIASNTVKLKNMSTGEQKCLPEQELISLF